MPVIPDISALAETFEREVMMNILQPRQAIPTPLDPAWIAEDNRPNLFAIAGTFLTLSILMVILRIYVKIRILKTLGPDDYVMVAALLFAIGNMICNILQSRNGWGRHLNTITPAHYKEYQHITFFKSQLFVLGVNAVKVSIALLLMRLTTLSRYRNFLWGTIVFMVCFTIACLGTLIFICSPIAGAWDPVVRAKGHCYSLEIFRNIGLFNTVVNVMTDVMFATIPIPLIWRLQANLRTRISLVLTLSLGYFACAAGIVKGVKQVNFLRMKDSTFWEEINTWGFVELNLGIIAACVPTVKPLLRKVFEYTKGGTRSNSHGPGPGRTPNGNLSYASAGTKKSKDRASAIQLSAINYQGKNPAKVEKSKYPHDTSGNESSNFEPHSPKTSQENILPNNIHNWPIRTVTGGINGIRMTTEVIVQHSANDGPNPVGRPRAGSFNSKERI